MGQCVSVVIHGKGDRVEILSTGAANPDSEGDSIFSVVEAVLYGILMVNKLLIEAARSHNSAKKP